MATIDNLDIQIAGSAKKANDAIDGLITNLNRLANSLKINTSGLEKIGKSLNFSGIDKATKSIQLQTQKVSKSLSQITEQYKNLGKGFEIKGSTQQIQKQINTLTNQLAKAKLTKEDFEASRRTNLSGYETAVKNVIKYTNQIESLKNQLAGLKKEQPRLDFKVTGSENITKYLVEYKKELTDFKNDIKSISDAYGGLQNVPKGFLDIPIQDLKQYIEELKQSYPQATNVISDFEKELQRLRTISTGLTKEPTRINFDINSVDRTNEKITELKNKFEKFGLDFKFTGNFEQLNVEIEKVYLKLNELKAKEQEMIFAGKVDTSEFERLQESIARVGNQFGIMQDLRDRTEIFNQSLQQLRVPEIREENLIKLQNALRKTEEDTEKLRIKLTNAITIGRIVPNIDNSGFRKLTEQIAISEKQAEALRQKIQEVGNNTSKTGNKLNGLSESAKKLSSSTKSLGNFANKAATNLKSLTRQALSAMGVYLGIYGAIKGLKNAIKNSMNYIEVLNYFNAAFEQVAEKADLSSFKELGYDSAEAYYNSFSERAEQLTQRMTGFKVSENGMLEATGGKSLGLDPSQLMNYQAMFGQMASSMGVASETSLKLSQTLTEIGTDLASVKNMDFDKVWADMASGLVGMSRTLDKYGVNIRNVNLQQKLNELGINANISALNQNDKALLRTITLLENTRYAWGNLADTLNQPANQLRLIKANFQNSSRTIGGLFLPILQTVMPYINALVIMLQRLFVEFAKILGVDLSKINKGKGDGGDVMSDLLDQTDELESGLGDSKKAADKLNKSLRAFDELNVINTKDNSEKNIGLSGIESGLLNAAFEDAFSEYQKVWDEAFNELENRAEELADKIETALEPITTPIKKLLEAIQKSDWDEAGKAVGQITTAIYDWINKAIEKVPWDKLGENVVKFVTNLPLGEIALKSIKLAINIAEAIIKFTFGAYQQIYEQYGIAGVIGTLLVPGGIVTVSLLADISTSFKDIKDLLPPELLSSLDSITERFQKLKDEVITPLCDTLKEIFLPIWQDISTLFYDLWQNIIEPIAAAIKDNLSKAFEGLVDIYDRRIAPMISAWEKAFTFLHQKILIPLTDFLGNIFKPIFDNVFNGIKETIENLSKVLGGIIDFITGVFAGNWSKAWNGIKDIFKGIFNGIPNIVETVINSIISIINKLIGGVNSISSKVGIPKIPEIPDVKLPRLEKGGITLKHTFAEIGEYNKPEAVMPLTDRRAMRMIADSIFENTVYAKQGTNYEQDYIRQIEEATYRGTMRAIQAAGGIKAEATFKVESDRDSIFKITQEESNKYFERTGKPAYDF